MNQALTTTRATARQFLLQALRLERPGSLPDAAAALDALEFVQMDSINVCGRMHDLILQSRIPGYQTAQLDEVLYGVGRRAFEYYFPNLCALPLRDYPYFVRAMRARTAPEHPRALSAAESRLAEQLLERIAAEGPLRTRAGDAGNGMTLSAWGVQRKVATHVLEKLWLQGRLAVQRRENFERWYDLAERLLPPQLAALQRGGVELPPAEEERVWKARKRLRSQRLFRPSRADLATLGRAAFAEVVLEGSSRPWFVLAEDLDALSAAREAASEVANQEPEVNLLAPLDPLVYDRARTQALFDFEYVWEVYTPARKRRWGYYVLPILWGDRLAGRLDPQLDRTSGTLRIHSLLLEPAIDVEEIAAPLAACLGRFARFLGAARVRLGRTRPTLPRHVRQQLERP
jgi:uncharacterized protein